MPELARREEVVFVLSAAGADASAGLEVFELVLRHKATLVAVADITAQCDSDNPPTGSIAQIDVNKNGTSIFSTVLSIDANESDSDTAATPAVLTTTPTEFAAGDVLTFDLDQVGSTNPGREYKVTIRWVRPN